MHFSSSIIATILGLVATTLAAPAMEPRAEFLTIKMTNDITGVSADATVISDGLARTIPHLFADSALDNAGSIYATSAQLIRGYTDMTKCFFQNGNDIINFNGTSGSFVDLDGDRARATLVWMNPYNIQCAER